MSKRQRSPDDMARLFFVVFCYGMVILLFLFLFSEQGWRFYEVLLGMIRAGG